MSVRIDELSSEVIPEPEPQARAVEQAGWETEDAFRALRERLERDAARTRSEAYDD